MIQFIYNIINIIFNIDKLILLNILKDLNNKIWSEGDLSPNKTKGILNSENELIFDKKYSQVRLDISNHLINNENLKKILYDKRIFSTIKKYLNKTDVKITNIGVIHSLPFKNPNSILRI